VAAGDPPQLLYQRHARGGNRSGHDRLWSPLLVAAKNAFGRDPLTGVRRRSGSGHPNAAANQDLRDNTQFRCHGRCRTKRYSRTSFPHLVAQALLDAGKAVAFVEVPGGGKTAEGPRMRFDENLLSTKERAAASSLRPWP